MSPVDVEANDREDGTAVARKDQQQLDPRIVRERNRIIGGWLFGGIAVSVGVATSEWAITGAGVAVGVAIAVVGIRRALAINARSAEATDDE